MRTTSKAVVLTAMVLGTIYSLLLGFEFFAFPPKRNLRLKRQTLARLFELRQQGKKAFPAPWPLSLLQPQGSQLISPVKLEGKEVIPLSGVIDAAVPLWWGFSSPLDWQYVTYQGDERGFRNPTGTWSKPVSLALLGDSFTIGLSATTGKSYAELIAKEFPGTLNSALYGNSPIGEMAIAREFLAYKKPKVLVWFFYEENDLYDLSTEMQSPLLMKYLDPGFSQGLWSKQKAVDEVFQAELLEREKTAPNENPQASDRIIDWPSRLALLNFRAQARFSAKKALVLAGLYQPKLPECEVIPKDLWEKTASTFSRTLALTQQSARAWGGKLLFVYLPFRGRFSGTCHFDGADKNRILELTKSLGIETVDLSPAFDAHPDKASLFPSYDIIQDIHYNDAGHALVHSELAPTLTKLTN